MSLSKRSSLLRILLAYLVAVVVGVFAGWLVVGRHPIWVAAVADVVATGVVFGFSTGWRNASTYDPYWSVAPPLLGVYWATLGVVGETVALRQLVVLVLVSLWGVRLTWNWVLRWHGMADEDWRYVDLRRRHGNAYFLVNLFGIHLLPTVLVFVGCLPLFAALADGSRSAGWLDVLGLVVTGGAIWIEARADRELRRFRAAGDVGVSLKRGLWALSRHPNYFGEVMFWWGLYLFALAANPAYWWTGIGALAITLLFVFISIPMMDERMLKRPDYAERIKMVPALIPWPRRKR